MEQAVRRASVCWLVGVLGLLGCADSRTSVLLTIQAGPGLAAPSWVELSVFTDAGTAVERRRLPESGELGGLPDTVVLYPARQSGELRILARGMEGTLVLGEGTARVTLEPERQVAATVTVHGGRLADRDKDGVPDEIDSCPDLPNPDQAGCAGPDGPDGGDGPTADGPGVPDGVPDGPADAMADTAVGDTTVDQAPDLPPIADQDGDKVPDALDNCPSTPNPTQADMDNDGEGDDCDSDIDGDTLSNTVDPFPTAADVVYYYETADHLLTDGYVDGTWTANGTELCQDNYYGGYSVTLKSSLLPGSDYLVETRFTVQATQPSSPDGYSVGLDIRSGGGSGYDCQVDLDGYSLLIGEWDPTDWQPRAWTAPQSVPATGPYRLRAVAKGTNLVCALVGPSPQPITQITDGSNPTGSVGVFTYRAKACFEYLLVIKAP